MQFFRWVPIARYPVIAIAVVFGSVDGLAVPAGATPSWSFQPSPRPPGELVSSLNDVVCLTARNCVTVGSYLSSPAGGFESEHTLVERWDGKRWSIVPSPSTRIFSLLSAVSCPAPGFCMAVGWKAGGALAETWNGARWSVVPTVNRPHQADVFLDAVSCRTSKDCFAVGSYFGGVGQYTQVEHWDGKRYSLVPSPNVPPRSNPGNDLFGISCTTGNTCIAVGSTGSTTGPLAERWDGSRWTVMPSAAGSKAGSVLRAVRCTSSTNCWAVGHTSTDKSLIERWDGTTWTIVRSPNRSQHNALLAVKCLTASNCVAVGGQSSTRLSFGTRLIEHWNGTTWAIVASPGPASTSDSYLSGVSCPTTATCMAVGRYNDHGLRKSFVERYGR